MKKLICLILIVLFLIFAFCGCDFSNFSDDIKSKLFGFESDGQIEVITEEYYVFSPEFDSCYNSLSSKQKSIYKKIYSICEEMPYGLVKVSNNYDDVKRDIAIAYRAVLNDNADIFWMPDTYIIGTVNDGEDISIAFNYHSDAQSVEYSVSRYERNKMRKELNTVVDSILDCVKNIKDQFEKEKFFNDYICENTEYTDKVEFEDTAYGCLVGKKALCEGYSRAFKLLCNRAKIECDLIVGTAQGEGHMWNSVNIDGIHSFVDVTWNDRPDCRYFYFNITSEQLEYDHTVYPLYKTVSDDDVNSGSAYNFVERKCTYSGNTYYEKNGYVLGNDFEDNYASKAADIITKRFTKGEKSADFMIASERIIKELSADETEPLEKIQRGLTGIKIESYCFERDILVVYFG